MIVWAIRVVIQKVNSTFVALKCVVGFFKHGYALNCLLLVDKVGRQRIKILVRKINNVAITV